MSGICRLGHSYNYGMIPSAYLDVYRVRATDFDLPPVYVTNVLGFLDILTPELPTISADLLVMNSELRDFLQATSH
jgi:hypothetical protein